MSFQRAMPHVRRAECHPACVGGDHARCYTKHPADPGGATCCGIIQRTYDAFRRAKQRPVQAVQMHSWDEHAEIYRERFWERGRCAEMPWPLSLLHMDACVNHGTEHKGPDGRAKVNAGRLLQLAARVLPADGIVGAQTLAAIHAGALNDICYRYLLERFFRYDDLADANPRLAQFQTGGWEQRLKDLYREVS